VPDDVTTAEPEKKTPPAKPEVKIETSGPQVAGLYLTGKGKGELTSALTATYTTYRTMRRDPTIALARAMSIAPILAGEWSVHIAKSGAPAGAEQFVKDVFVPMREHIMQTALYGGIDFGWQGYEKVFEMTRGANGRQLLSIRKFKPLLPDYATPLVDKETGNFAGYKITSGGLSTTLEVQYALHIPFRVEGTDWRGQSLMENARGVYNEWVDANNGAALYDRKVAGSHWVVYYPVGITEIDGSETDNYTVAKNILDALEASGSVVIPNEFQDLVDALNQKERAWKIEIIEDKGGHQANFVNRMRYLDVQKVRALLMPERVGLEGEHGTKAEAGEHKDLWYTLLELDDRHITQVVNWYAIDDLLAWNWGEPARGTVWLESAPLTDVSRGFLQSLYTSIMANPSLSLTEFDTVDTKGLKDELGVPVAEEGAMDHAAAPGATPDQVAEMRERAGAIAASLRAKGGENG
jgi:hypothetical protein